MGKCKKCGVEVPKEAMFCPNCGAGIPKEAPVEKIAGEKGRRKKKYVMIGGGIGAILLILLVIFAGTRPKVIDLNECRKIEIDGYDGVGNGNVYFLDLSKKIEEAVPDRIMKKMEDPSDIYQYIDVQVELSKYSELSNGDKITVTYKYDNEKAKKVGIKFKGKKEKITVKGLKKVKTVDIFKDLELKFEGTAPNLSTESEIIIEQNDASFWCTVSPCEDLDIGDEITIECTTEGMVNGIKPEKLKTTVKVPDTAEHYVTDPSELTAEDMQEIKDGLTKILKGEEPYEDRLDHSWMAIKSPEDVTDNNLEFYSRETASNITFSDTAEYFVNESYNEYTENVTDMLIRFELDDTVEDEESDKCGKTYHIYGYTILGPVVCCSDGKLQIEDDWDGIVFYISGTMGNVREKVEKDINEEVDKIMRDAPTRYIVAFDGSGKVEQIK